MTTPPPAPSAMLAEPRLRVPRPRDPRPAEPLSTALAKVLAEVGVRSVFQPIVDLEDGEVVGFEALSRGPAGTDLESPAALFGAARTSGLLAELDEACRLEAFRSASALGLASPLTVFVNVEPEVLDEAPLEDLRAVADGAAGGLRIVLEITERALASRPAELLRTVERVRDMGWGIALDDVGAEPASLAFMALLRPDVVKLDLSLVQRRPTPAVAEIITAVSDYAERSGAVVLAEGIETDQHLATARSLGATLGQGWLLGRPSATPQATAPSRPLRLTPPVARGAAGPSSPFACLPAGTVLQRSPKRLLIELSKHLEREAMRVGETCVVASTFQYREHFTAATAQRYRDLVARTGFACALGEGLPTEPVPGLRGATLGPGDPVLNEWDVAVLSPHFSAALLARDLGDTGPEMDRTFEYALTYDRGTVTEATLGLLSRVVAVRGAAATQPPTSTAPAGEMSLAGEVPLRAHVAGTSTYAVDDAVIHRALAETTSGLSIADATRPDTPLVFVNPAFERLAGYPAQELLGRNCRFLQGPDTDRAAVARIRAAIAAGRECRELLLNYRGTDRVPWWNEVHLSCVRDEHGRVRQYMAVQSDVTRRVEAERALALEYEVSRGYLARIEELASTDSLTGLMNRRRFEEHLEGALARAGACEEAVVLLFCDLDGFKSANDTWGHALGDQLLQQVADRFRAVAAEGAPLARFGGDEFVLAVTGVDRRQVLAEARSAHQQLVEACAQPFQVDGRRLTVGVSIGSAVYPEDGATVSALVHLADLRMYALKHPGSGPGSAR